MLGLRRGTILPALAASVALLSGCASTYGNLVSGSKLGAMEYQPAVVPVDAVGNGKYQEVLPVCRQVAVNRQVTAAQEAQLKTITGVGGGALSGAAAGLQMGSMFKNAGFGASLNKSAGIGAAVGILAGLGDSFSSGTSQGAEETRRILLNCLKASDPEGKYYRVVE